MLNFILEYFSSKRDELQEMLLNDPIMSVDEL